MADTAMAALGRIDILINCAASPAVLDSDELARADIDALGADLNVKTLGYLRCAQVLAPCMTRNAWGRIVNIGGLTARMSDTLSGMRNVALSHLTKSLADQLGPQGITVNQVNPGLVRTAHVEELFAKRAAREGITISAAEQEWCGSTPIRRMLEPTEIADLVSFISSPLAGGINGQSITIDGGLTRGIYL
jgi:NAD(P)-dependent dehydrogenase (short-subunit alcohol dehydrogenase family)